MRFSIVAALVLPGTLLGFAACGGEAFTTSDGDDGNESSSGGDSNGSGGASESGGSSSGGQGTGAGGSGTGGSNDFETDCFSSFECELIQNACCPSCSSPTIDNVTAITTGQTQLVNGVLCGDEPPPCPACEPMGNPNLFAQCVGGTCQAQDLRAHEDAACNESADCAVIPAACCPCGAGNGPGEIVAASLSAQHFREAQCTVTPICDDCVWDPPAGVSASCVDGFCALSEPPTMP